MLNKKWGYFFIITFEVLYVIGCSSNRLIVEDTRIRFKSFFHPWKPVYENCDTASGIKMIFVEHKTKGLSYSIAPGDNEEPARYVDTVQIELTFWEYPIDTTTVITTEKNVLLPEPRGGFADITTIRYRINNDSLIFNKLTDFTRPIFIELKPGTYLLKSHLYYYVSRYLRDVEIRKNKWAVVEIDTIRHRFFNPVY